MRYIFLFLAIILISPNTSLGQFDNLTLGGIGTDNNSIIEISPKFPEPNEVFTAKLNDYSLSGQTSSVIWKVDGITLDNQNNQRSITLKANPDGKTTIIEAALERSGGTSVISRKVITPIYLDIIVEAQTRTPAFYLGRSLPSKDSIINLTAITSTDTPTNDLVYTWKLNDKVLEGGPLRGRSTISANVPLGQTFFISVEVKKIDGTFLASQSSQIRTFDPEILFYEKNTLFGVNTKALTNYNLIGSSATIIAEPFNLDIRTYNNPSLLEWEVDGKKSDTTFGNPYEITLARPTGIASGGSNINFQVRNLSGFLVGAEGKFKINF